MIGDIEVEAEFTWLEKIGPTRGNRGVSEVYKTLTARYLQILYGKIFTDFDKGIVRDDGRKF